MKPVVCLGGLTIDEIYHVPAFPEVDNAQLILESVESYGGRGALVALILGMLNTPISLFTAVGNDF
jgi:sugar/nucleoside kinase (ribokinase family)